MKNNAFKDTIDLSNGSYVPNNFPRSVRLLILLIAATIPFAAPFLLFYSAVAQTLLVPSSISPEIPSARSSVRISLTNAPPGDALCCTTRHDANGGDFGIFVGAHFATATCHNARCSGWHERWHVIGLFATTNGKTISGVSDTTVSGWTRRSAAATISISEWFRHVGTLR
jgi:hypothetical protein